MKRFLLAAFATLLLAFSAFADDAIKWGQPVNGLRIGIESPLTSVSPSDGSVIPIPPQQTAPWSAPETKLPSNLVSACGDLFDAGLSDPRGCEYREIVLLIQKQAEGKTTSETLKTHAWVLPSEQTEVSRYAICWNGLTYPVTSVGPAADLRRDIGSLLSENSTAFSHDPTRPLQSESLAYDELTLIKIPLLLRLGIGQPAEQLWQKWSTLSQFSINDGNQKQPFDPFTILFREWLWANYSRAMEAHLLGDARLALAYVQAIPSLRTKVEELALKRGIPLAKTSAFYRQPDASLDLTFLNQAPALLEDEQRRVQEKVTNLDDVQAPEKIADKKQRIAVLIRDLEDVEAYSMMSPGYIEFGMDTRVQALIQQGEDAVDPLLDCLEKDPRLTRTLDDGGGRHFQAFGYARIVGVEEPAFAALQGILNARDQFPSLDEPYANTHPAGVLLKRAVLAVRIREYWKKYRNHTQAERWYGILQDNQATPQAWAEAAENIVLPEDADLFSGFGVIMIDHNSANPVRFRGEVLRGKTAPSVSELIIKRMRDSLAVHDPKWPFPLDAPRRLAAALAKWDGKNQIETLRWYCGKLQKIILTETDSNGPGEIEDLVKTYLKRHELGDEQALSDYAQWLRAADAQKLDKLSQMYGAFYLSPFWSYPDDPAMVSLAKWLFEDSKSPWSTGPGGVDPDWIANSVHSPLEAIPAFRALIVRGLRNKKVVGSVEVTPTNIMVQYHYGNGDSNNDPDVAVGTKQPVRLCDYIASRISRYQGAPRFETYWPESRRDRVIEDSIAFLEHYGNQLSYQTSSENDSMGYPSFPDDFPHFPVLDHPASHDEAAAGHAIFSLEGKGERRAFKLSSYPFRANWTTLKDRRVVQHGQRADGTTTDSITYPQEGLIWQAEDVLLDGKWQRYYGYSGCGHIAAVPGDQIEFVPADGFDPMGDGWGFSVNLHGDDDFTWDRPLPDTKPGQPFPLTVGIKNLRGSDRPLPVGAPAAGTISAQNADLKLTVSFTPHPRKETSTFPPNPAVKWDVLVPKAPVTLEVMPLPSALAPLDGKPYLRLDLAKWYDFNAPGTYRVEFQFIKNSPFASEYGHLPMDFEVSSKN